MFIFMIHSSSASAGIFSDLFSHRDTLYARWRHEGIACSCKFSNEYADANYDFSKRERIFIFDTDTSMIEDVTVSAMDFNKSNRLYVKKMKCKLVEKNLADAVIEIKFLDWHREFHHREPEKTVYGILRGLQRSRGASSATTAETNTALNMDNRLKVVSLLKESDDTESLSEFKKDNEFDTI